MSLVNTLTNKHNLSLPMAVWLVDAVYSASADSEQAVPEKEIFSATTLLKPTRQLVLSERVTENVTDLSDKIASTLGNSIHDAIHQSWVRNYRENLAKLGYSEEFINSIVINPKLDKIDPTKKNLFLEKRFFKDIDGYAVSGKPDMIFDGAVQDYKSTSVYGYLNDTNAKKYIQQGSIYRWLVPDIITSDMLTIHYIFTDWQSSKKDITPNYPQTRIISKEFPLMSLEETERFIKSKLQAFKTNRNSPETNIVRCTDEDLWRGKPTYKYYSKPENAKLAGARATKVFGEDKAAANAFLREKGYGVVVEFPAAVRACKYCFAFNICTQKDEYLNAGLL